VISEVVEHMPVHLITNLRELAPRYDGFILDLWGVIHDGVSPIPGAIDCLRSLIDTGKRITLLSNAPRRADDDSSRSYDVMYRTGPPAGEQTGPAPADVPPQLGV